MTRSASSWLGRIDRSCFDRRRFVFGEPLGARCSSQVNEAPMLVVIWNDGRYDANTSPLVTAATAVRRSFM